MRTSLYNRDARRKPVRVRLNKGRLGEATAAGINISRTAEEAPAMVYEETEKARIRQEIREAVRITDEMVRKHGHPFPEWLATFVPEDGEEDAA